MVRRQIERERELNAVRAFVSDKLFGDPVQLRRRVRELAQCFLVLASSRTHKVIWRFGGTLMPGDKPCPIIRSECHYGLILSIVALEDALGFLRLQIETIQERELAFL